MSNRHSPGGLPEEWMLVVNAGVDPVVETEWNDWYDRVHLPDILGCPGFVEAERYVTADDRGGRRYQTIYRLTGPDAISSAEFSQRRGWAHFVDHVEASVRLFRRTGAQP